MLAACIVRSVATIADDKGKWRGRQFFACVARIVSRAASSATSAQVTGNSSDCKRAPHSSARRTAVA